MDLDGHHDAPVLDPMASELWPTDPAAARAVQERLRGLVERDDRFGPVHRVAALDAHYAADNSVTWAAAVLLDAADMTLLRSALVCKPTRFPYVPGLLSFREVPAMLDSLAMLGERPDLVVVDGHGTAHPRRLGIASHVGVLSGLPTIGVGKSLLCGRFVPPGPTRGDQSPLIHRHEVVGTVLRTRDGISPVFVSTGHRVSQESAVRLILGMLGRYRLPEPTRIADAVSRMHPPGPKAPQAERTAGGTGRSALSQSD
ncbi:deoxyribonuclease V [Arenibaculum pallidiluteum]|uniref:deoxyribonuclease V n=1 Tax=Arenibaculum pallidiluteum TaxID=2812559 RepID=UPI001A97135C|nr:deoxyribonuclease V [Arenibaculum pallidiluteum]